ncbi:TrkH family potassium uptake protein [Actibacterium pelagium]|uniref:Potassium transporter TrkH n=1 Tax=Actibacterium pelagium TaxID=2029103 RepID=A0A917ACL5_9RHOB|nr:potassium transporter TrkG [Actibacterium pelagium]GGE42876.1 potassium transporter TrkH [Actibacterium pelagium]
MQRVLNVHFFIFQMGVAALAMLIPFIHAVVLRDWGVARAFFYSSLLLSILTALLGVASYNSKASNLTRSHLLAVLFAFTILPLILAVPFYEAVGNTTLLNSFVEMVSCITTTGATLFDDAARLAPSVHLWRGLVGWMGGYFIWLCAIAILAPMNLGGFEISTDQRHVGLRDTGPKGMFRTDPRERLLRFSLKLLPVYAGLTGTLWLLLVMAGQTPLVGIMNAMATLSTSGITTFGPGASVGAGRLGELLVLIFLVFAISRQTFAQDFNPHRGRELKKDPEIRLAAFLIISIPILMFLRHWVGALEVEEEENILAALRAFWGALFTVSSFLTTTGFVSTDWGEAQLWSGLSTPGMILLGLAMIGGGVATTAGGVKLMRVMVLYKHGLREMEKLVHPSSVGHDGTAAKELRRRSAYVAWIFFMLFALSLTVVMLFLSAYGLSFEEATVLAVAALSTTGPLTAIGGGEPILLGDLADGAKLVFASAMVLGRLETLVIIALFNPDFWRG